jgi:transcriptional regulator with XRE-family HTH domain
MSHPRPPLPKKDTIKPFQIANGLRALRLVHGLSLHNLQSITGIHRYTLEAYEHNFIEPSASDVFVIVSTLRMPISHFYQFIKTLEENKKEDNLSLFFEKKKSTLNTKPAKEKGHFSH